MPHASGLKCPATADQAKQLIPSRDRAISCLAVDFRDFAVISVSTHEAIDTCRLLKNLVERQAPRLRVVAPEVNAYLGAHHGTGITDPVGFGRGERQQ